MYLPKGLVFIMDEELDRLSIMGSLDGIIIAFYDKKTKTFKKLPNGFLRYEAYLSPVSDEMVNDITEHMEMTQEDYDRLGIKAIDWENIKVRLNH